MAKHRRGTYSTTHKDEVDSSNVISGLSVSVRGDDQYSFEKALRQFNKKVQNAGIIKEVRNRQHYIKPSEQKQIDKKAGRARHLKEVREKMPKKKP